SQPKRPSCRPSRRSCSADPMPRGVAMKTLLFATLLLVAAAAAEAADSTKVVLPDVQARRLTSSLNIDGLLNEAAWATEPAQAHFIQTAPPQGVAPTFDTQVRVLYDDDAIYIGARMLDSAPDSIVARLARRDVQVRSDELCVFLDPYHDKR